MKKVIIFLGIIIILFAAVGIITKMQNEEKVSEENPYGKNATLHAETIKQLDDPNYQNIILPDKLEEKLDNKEDVTVYFYSPICPHCLSTTPIVAPLAKEMEIDLVQYNLLEFEKGWDKYGITETPTIVQYKDGEEVNRITGYKDEAVFKEWFNENSK
ncbi:thioredoxin family protein [Bacillus sp. FJAT-49705]|uniref:Thioredoxin family protein n=1 Tax=Cytobacillus citreus TaxID=2833586 RepID=A0ABS5NLM7_9BACI|nr:thioredoxin family protein [Cytobacillus citreus]MBS4188710.1 thioredoxin family protein [Cytobacillus citreus]